MGVHIGNKIKEVSEKNGIKPTEFGRRINKSRETVYNIFKRKSIDTALLEKISQVLNFDFFTYFTPVQKELDRLREENELLREMNTFLKQKNKKGRK